MKSTIFLILFPLVFSLMNGPAQWTDFGSGYQGGSYDTYRAGPNLSPSHVVVFGLVTATSTSQLGVTAILPSQLSPSYEYIFAVQQNPDIAVRVDVTTNGEIIYQGGSSGNNWLSFAPILYPLPSFVGNYLAASLAGGWSNYGSPYSSASYVYDNGVVYLSGVVSTSSAVPDGAGSIIFALPSGSYYPLNDIYLTAEAYPNEPVCIYIPAAGGDVTLYSTSTSGTFSGWVSLDGIAFDINTNWQTLSLPTGWVWSTSNTNLYQVQGKMVFMTNMIYSSSWSSGVLFTLPTNARPANQQIFSAYSFSLLGTGIGGVVRVDVSSAGQVILTAPVGASGYLSLSSIRFMTK